MRKIVLPTDFSENAYNALKYAVELFKYERCEFFLLHAFADEAYNNTEIITQEQLEEVKNQLQQKHSDSLEQVLQKIREHSPNPRHHFQTHLTFGALIDEINDLVNRENADIVVMGTRGKTNNFELSFGSNTLQVIKYIQCPVLSIPAQYQFMEPSEILFPSNFMIPYQRRELKLIGEIARCFNAEMHMLYISNFPLASLRQKENKDFIQQQFSEVNVKYHRVEEQERVEAIMDHIEKWKINLLVMVNSRYTYLENIITESTIDKLSLHPKIPFLVLQNFNRESR